MNVEDLTKFTSFNRLQFSPVEISPELHLAIAGDDHLVIINNDRQEDAQERSDHAFSQDNSSIVIEFDQDAGRPTLLSWVDARVLCIGFESGLLSCFDVTGEELFVFRGSTSSAKALRVSAEKEGLRLWCLYDEGLLVSILLKQACLRKFDEAIGYKLSAQAVVDDFVLFIKRAGHGGSLFDDSVKDQLRAMVVGTDNAVAIYDLTCSSSNALDEGQRRDKGSSITKSIYSMFSAISGYADAQKPSDEEYTWSRNKLYSARCVLSLDDGKRRVFRISLDPTGSLAATADSLGRVLLYDLRSETAVRIWKGIRDARLGWVLDGSADDAVLLTIYAPMLGLVSLYKMRNGPCQRVIAVGLSHSLACTPMLRVSLTGQARESAAQNFILKFHSDNNMLEMVPIKAGVNSDSELEEVAKFVKEHQQDGAASWEESLRASAMHASIQEVMEREQQLRKSILHSGKELCRLLTDWISAQKRNRGSRFQSPKFSFSEAVDAEELERAILGVLGREMTLSSLLTLLAVVEMAELTGQILEVTSYSQDEIVPVFSNAQMRTNGFFGRFSVDFHKSMCSILKSALDISTEGTQESLHAALHQELCSRLELLKAYDLLASIQSADNRSNASQKGGVVGANLTALQRDDATQICKQNTFRAEALCWTLRSIKKINPAVDAAATQSPTVSAAGAVASPVSGSASVTYSTDKPGSTSPKRVTRLKSTSPRPTPTLIPEMEDIAQSKGAVPAAVNVMISFPTFRLCFLCSDEVLKFRHHDLQSLLQLGSSELDMSPSAPRWSLENVSNFVAISKRQACADNEASCTGFSVSSAHGHLIADLLFHPLLGDLVSLHTFTNALKVLDLHSHFALRDILPLFVQFLSRQTLQTLVAEILTKKMSVSPLQRWLRDHLLTFQDSFSNYLASVQKTETGEPVPDSSRSDSSDLPEPASRRSERSESISEDQGILQEVEKHIVDELVNFRIRGESNYPTHPTVDQSVRYLFRSAWVQCRNETNLEFVLALSAVLLETLYTVNDQIERRTFGSENLKYTIASWENLIRQVRVLLFIKNRIYDHRTTEMLACTVNNLSDGKLSLFRILAMDTLVFALRAEQAREHELQCLEVYKRRIQESTSADASSSTISAKAAQSDVLLAWGKVADKKWRDIITIAMNEDTMYRQGSQDGTQRRRRKPLLLYFPDHNHLDIVGAYRSILLAERWSERIDKMETLALVCEHLFDLSSSWRAVLALHVYSQYVLPVVQMLLDLEEDRTVLMPTPERRKQLLNLMGEVAYMNAFIRSSSEIINFVLEGRSAALVSLQQTVPAVLLQFLRYRDMNPFRDEVAYKIWPVPMDLGLSQIFLAFYSSFRLESGESVAIALAGENGVHSDEVAGQWTSEALLFHLTLLAVLQLRFQCGLRGVKPSQLLGNVVHDLLGSMSAGQSVGISATTVQWNEVRQNAYQDKDVIQARFEFIEQTLRRTTTQAQSSFSFNLSMQWGFSKDLTRLLQMKAVLEQTGSISSRDEELEQMIPLFDNKDLIVDALISAVRHRLGGLLLGLERHAATHSTLLASLDSEAVAWAKLGVTSHPGCSISPIAFKSEDLSSSRQLIIYVQGLLFAVPVNNRKDGIQPIDGLGVRDGGLDDATKARIATSLSLTRQSSWLDRKTRCDALLSLCNILMQALQAAAAATARKK